jgi:hypothetical protein
MTARIMIERATTGTDDLPPDLTEWVARHGGYHQMPWPEWDKAVADWQMRRRERLEQERLASLAADAKQRGSQS